MTGAPMPAGADAVVMVERTRSVADAVEILEAATPGDHVRPAGGDLEAGQRVFEAGTLLTPAHLGVLASLDVRRGRCAIRARASACAPPATSSSSAGRSRRASSATRTGRCCSPCSRKPAASRSTTASRATTRPTLTDDDHPRRRRVRRARHERRGVDGRLRLREGRARAPGRGAPGQHVRVDADRDQARQAARVRGDRRRAGVRAAGQPGVVARELRAARPARAAAARGPRRRARRARARRGRGDFRRRTDGRRALRPGDRSATRTAGTCASGPGSRPATCSRAWPRRSGLAVLEDGEGAKAGDLVPVLLLGGA